MQIHLPGDGVDTDGLPGSLPKRLHTYLELPEKKDDYVTVFYHQTEEMLQMKWPLMNATNARHFTTTFGLILQLLIRQMTCPSFQEMAIKQNSVAAACPVLHRATH